MFIVFHCFFIKGPFNFLADDCFDHEDAHMANTKIPWALHGMTVHNCVVALCIAPCTHKDLRLAQRCEVALSGFLCIDLFRMAAESLCSARTLPRGSLFMAPQTCHNLQGVALSVIVVCLTKSPDFSPWTRGQSRLSEIGALERLLERLDANEHNKPVITVYICIYVCMYMDIIMHYNITICVFFL